MGRWIERRHRHDRRARRFEIMWGWPYSPWYFLWLCLFFGQFFLRLAASWGVFHVDTVSSSFSTLPESISLSRAYAQLDRLNSPVTLAKEAAADGDFRVFVWPRLRRERRRDPYLCFRPWPALCEAMPDFDDVTHRVIEGAFTPCEEGLATLMPHYNWTKSREPLDKNSHILAAHNLPEFCRAEGHFGQSFHILEERGYNGRGSYIPREALAFHMRFMSYLHTYNKTLMAHPKAPPDMKSEWAYLQRRGDIDYPLYAEFLHRRVSDHVFKEWVTWKQPAD